MTVNEQLFDRLIIHYLAQERLKNGMVSRFVPILRKLDSLFIGLFTGVYGGTKAEMNQFIAQVKRDKKIAYAKFEKELTKELNNLSDREANYIYNLLGGIVTTKVTTKPRKSSIDRVIKTDIRGFTLPQMISTLEIADINRYVSAAKTAINDGLTLQESINRLRTTIKTSNRQASTVIHTLISAITNEADDIVFRDNDNLISGIRLNVTLDTSTTDICIRHSIEDILYPIDDYPHPPFHMGERTRAMPQVKSFTELSGKDKSLIPKKTRVSMDGDLPFHSTYADWFKQTSHENRVKAVGMTRAILVERKRLKVIDLVNPQGEFYTLDELFN